MVSKDYDLADSIKSSNFEEDDDDPIERASLLLQRMFSNLGDLKRPSGRKVELRASGLPFCPIRSFMLDKRGESYSMDHYVTTGTAIHTTLQKWLPLGDYSHHVWGNWKCTACNRLHRHTLKPGKCKSCSHDDFLYDEVSLIYKNLSMHIDLILQVEHEGNPAYVVVDFKTTDMERKRSNFRWNPNKPSSMNYIAQVRTYCTVLEVVLGIKVLGWLLPSINRAAPIKSPQDYSILASGDWNKSRTKKWLKFLDRANHNFLDYKGLMSAISARNKGDIKDALNLMIKYRPCQSYDDYDAWMAYGFYGKDKCILKDVCCKQSHASVKEAVKTEIRKLR